jgi:2-polyprenyl-3-methyl-5-hydroxy-6-metoxy-1,4-benzoquinol methylase
MLLNKKPSTLLPYFLKTYKNVQNIDIDIATNQIKNLMKQHSTGDKNFTQLINLENRWYDSLKKNKIDYSIYDDDDYFLDLWLCWIFYSRRYLRDISKKNSLTETTSVLSILKDVKSILDIGCGIGYTTAVLKQIFTNADVYGLNIENTKQYSFCEYMSKKYNFNIISDINKINTHIDLIFASEYFEHIQNPVEHLQDILVRYTPKYLIIANAFNTRAMGHFITYIHNGSVIQQNKISKVFNNILISNDYKKVKTKLWNNRPTIWVKNNIR